jgi:hypothetical protein
LNDLDVALRGLRDIDSVADVFTTALHNFMAGNATEDPHTTHEKLHWAILLLRARMACDGNACARALRRFPSLRELPLHVNDDALTDLIANLARKSISEQLREIAADPSISEMKKLAKKEALRRRAAAWSPLRRTAKTMTILDSHGLPAATPQDGAELLRKHWRRSFTGSSTSYAPMQFFTAYIQQAPEDISWHMPFDDFIKLLMSMSDSAPGPDGIPYSAFQNAPVDIHNFLYACYEDVLHNKPIPLNFNDSFLVFLPKGEVDADSFHTARTPDTT